MITVEQKLSNILRNFHRNSPHPEADPGDIDAAIAAIWRATMPDALGFGEKVSANDNREASQQRIQDLLEANDRYLQRARDAEAASAALRTVLCGRLGIDPKTITIVDGRVFLNDAMMTEVTP